jgi:hypothetical protein
MKVALQYTLRDYYDAARLHYAGTKVKYVIAIFGIIFVICGIVMISLADLIAGLGGLFELLVGAYFLTYAYVGLWFKARYAFNRAPGFRAPHNFEINETELKIDTPERGVAIWYWKTFIGSRQNAKVLLFYISDRLYIIFPQRAFTDSEWQQVVAISQSKVPRL